MHFSLLCDNSILFMRYWIFEKPFNVQQCMLPVAPVYVCWELFPFEISLNRLVSGV